MGQFTDLNIDGIHKNTQREKQAIWEKIKYEVKTLLDEVKRDVFNGQGEIVPDYNPGFPDFKPNFALVSASNKFQGFIIIISVISGDAHNYLVNVATKDDYRPKLSNTHIKLIDDKEELIKEITNVLRDKVKYWIEDQSYCGRV